MSGDDRGFTDTTGWWRLARLQWRTNRARLIMWPLVIAGLVASTAVAIAEVYDSPARRASYAATVSSSAVGLAFNGRAYAVDTIGGITAVELGFFALMVFPVIASHLAIRLTRTEEAAGRLELLSARQLGRTAALRAAALTGGVTLALTGLLSSAGLALGGLGVVSSGLYALSLTLLMGVFAGVGLVAAQLATDGRSAHGIALAAIAVMFVARAVIDIRRWPATWLTPTGWLAEVRPFDERRTWPIVALAGTCVLLGGLASWLNARRDLGAGVVQPRPGSGRGTAELGTPIGLVRRLTRVPLIGWILAAVLWAFALGLVAREMRSLVETNPDIAKVLGPVGTEPERLMLALAALFVGLLAVGYLAMAFGVLAGEETSDRLGVLLAGPLTRARWWVSALTVLAGHCAVVVVLGGLALGGGAAIGLRQPGRVWDGLWWSATYLPGVVLAGAVMAVLVAVSPALRGLCWLVFSWTLTVAMLGETLRMPSWLRNLSPLQHVPRVPAVDPSIMPLVVLGLAALAVGGCSTLVLARRDIGGGRQIGSVHAALAVRFRAIRT